MKYTLIVGNIGTVIETNSEIEAMRAFRDYCKEVDSRLGRASGETVTLMISGEIGFEYASRLANKEI